MEGCSYDRNLARDRRFFADRRERLAVVAFLVGPGLLANAWQAYPAGAELLVSGMTPAERIRRWFEHNFHYSNADGIAVAPRKLYGRDGCRARPQASGYPGNLADPQWQVILVGLSRAGVGRG